LKNAAANRLSSSSPSSDESSASEGQ
jgi:hypothetical protein